VISSYLGWQAYPIGIIGQDQAGELVAQDVERFGVRTEFLERDHNRQTPIIVEQIRKNIRGKVHHRFLWTCPNCGEQLPGYRTFPIYHARLLSERLPVPTVFFFDRVSRGILHIAEACATKGALVVFEPSGVKEPKLFQEAVSMSHIVKYSHQRMGTLNFQHTLYLYWKLKPWVKLDFATARQRGSVALVKRGPKWKHIQLIQSKTQQGR